MTMFSDGPLGFLAPLAPGSEEFVPAPEPAPEPPPPDEREWTEGPTAPQCEADVCVMDTRDIAWSGRGRKPRQHKECRAAAKTGGSASDDAPRISTRGRAGRLQQLTEDLIQGAGEASAALVPFAPVTAVTMGQGAPPAMAALVQIADDWERRGHPGMMRGLELAAQTIPYGTVASYAGAIIFAIGVDMGRVDPHSYVAERLGVAEAAERAGVVFRPDPGEAAEYVPVTNDGAYTAPPPSFQWK